MRSRAGVTDATPGVWAAVARSWPKAVASAGVADLGDELERPVEPGPEPVGQGGVGLVGGRARRVGAGVGGAEPQAEDRQGDHDHDGEGAPRATSALRASTTRAQRSQKPLRSVLAGAAGGQGGPFPPGQDLGARGTRAWPAGR